MSSSASSQQSLFASYTVAIPVNELTKCSAIEERRSNPHRFHHAKTCSHSTRIEYTTRRPFGGGVCKIIHGHGWTTCDDGSLVTNLMTGPPATEGVSQIAIVQIRCCRPNERNGLKYTASCTLQTWPVMMTRQSTPTRTRQTVK